MCVESARTVWRENQGRVNVLRYPTLTLRNCGPNKRMRYSGIITVLLKRNPVTNLKKFLITLTTEKGVILDDN